MHLWDSDTPSGMCACMFPFLHVLLNFGMI
jgi:hypothetical protein